MAFNLIAVSSFAHCVTSYSQMDAHHDNMCQDEIDNARVQEQLYGNLPQDSRFYDYRTQGHINSWAAQRAEMPKISKKQLEKQKKDKQRQDDEYKKLLSGDMQLSELSKDDRDVLEPKYNAAMEQQKREAEREQEQSFQNTKLQRLQKQANDMRTQKSAFAALALIGVAREIF